MPLTLLFFFFLVLFGITKIINIGLCTLYSNSTFQSDVPTVHWAGT